MKCSLETKADKKECISYEQLNKQVPTYFIFDGVIDSNLCNFVICNNII